MKTVFSNSEIVHVWAKQSQESGKTSNRSMFFEKNVIYSYGYHFAMAKIIGSKALVTTRKYSNATAKQLGSVRYAVNHLETIYVPYPELEFEEKNCKHWMNEIKELLPIISNTRKKEETRDNAKRQIAGIIKSIDNFCSFIGASITKKWSFNDEIRKEFMIYYNAAKAMEFDKITLHVKKLESAIERKAKAKFKKNITDWLNGGRHIYGIGGPVYLRVLGDIIETSHGAKVSLKAGKVLFDLIKAGKDIKGFDIDGYTVIGLNGVLTIGCHKIERKELNRFAKLQGWGQIDLH